MTQYIRELGNGKYSPAVDGYIQSATAFPQPEGMVGTTDGVGHPQAIHRYAGAVETARQPALETPLAHY